MPQIEISSTPAQPGRRPMRQALWSRQSTLNDTVAWLLLVLVAVAPVPLGSNRGFFWAVTAVLVGLTGVLYTYWLSRLDEPARFGLGRMRLSLVLTVLLGLFLVAQTIPFDLLGPWAEQARQQFVITTPTGALLVPDAISLAPQATWLMLLRMVTYAVFYLLVLQVSTNHRRKAFLLNAALLVVTCYAIYGFVSLVQLGDTILGLPKWAYLGSATATFVNRNSFATFLAFGSVIAMALTMAKLVPAEDGGDGGGASRRFDPTILLYLLAFTIIVAVLFATQSRMGFAAAAAGNLAIMLVGLARTSGRSRLLALLALIALGTGFVFLTYGQGLLERLGSVESASDVRLDLYAQVIEMIRARPLVGYGGGAFELAFPLFHQAPVSADMVWDRAHNTYLALWVELGVIAGSIPILLVLMAGARIVGGLGRVRADWPARTAGLGVLVVGATHSLVDFSLEIQANTLLFLMIVAIAVAGLARSSHHPTH